MGYKPIVNSARFFEAEANIDTHTPYNLFVSAKSYNYPILLIQL
jgi:hypothetical protein